MFTGLVEEIGKVRSVRPNGTGAVITIEALSVLEGLSIGDSVSLSGACQTVVAFDHSSFTVEAVRETLRRTNFGTWKTGQRVNLERALRPLDRLGGHFVQGHVDGIIEVLEVRRLGGSWRLMLSLPETGGKYIVEKGSVALDGVSLTVAAGGSGHFEVEVIPHTWSNTTLGDLKRGDRVHVEWDLIAKYVENMVNGGSSTGGLTREKLFESGF